jgi:hypothetical protein
MSKLEVDAIEPQSGTTLTIGASGDTITIPSGATFDASNATVTYPAGSITDAAISSTAAIQQSKILGSPGFRNIFINGDMSLAQRGTTVTGNTNGGYTTCDRWNAFISSLGTWTITQGTDVPTGQGFANSFKWDCTTADASPAAGDIMLIQQIFEGQNLQYLKKGTANAESLTLSFWVKCNKTGSFSVSARDIDNNRRNNNLVTINSANTWEKKTITFVGDTTGTLDNDNAGSFSIQWWLDAGSTYTSGTMSSGWEASVNGNIAAGLTLNLGDDTANEFYLTGVQLEAGTTASDFEFLPVDVNLARCQRYFQIVSTITGNATTSEIADMQVQPINNLRASPTVSQNGVLNVYDDQVGAFTQSTTGIGTIGTFNTKGGIVRLSNFSGMTTNRFLLTSGSSNGVTLSSEL